jgi:hypothetical protein
MGFDESLINSDHVEDEDLMIIVVGSLRMIVFLRVVTVDKMVIRSIGNNAFYGMDRWHR